MAITLKQDLEGADEFLNHWDREGVGPSVVENMGLKTKAAQEFMRVAIANARLMDRKQLDYGPKNISNFGVFGVMVRMNDKMERLKTLFGTGKRKAAKNESIQDSLRDISNYAIIALLIELDRWPNE